MASGAVVGLILGVHDPLDGGAAVWTGLAVTAVNGHLLPEGSNLFGEPIPCLASKALGPFDKCLLRGLEQSRDFVLGELLGEPYRREPGVVENLVGVGVANPAEQPGVCQCSLQRMVLPNERPTKGQKIRVEDLEPTRVVVTKCHLAAHEVKRCSPL